ncbi:MAG: ATP phosphoribosyltransferase regulatory subunit, partial [Coriobacteriia bacterium]|nr:ATP phosphoribosyltransferase regulatory subunit [Coriobacteriia bacterium]
MSTGKPRGFRDILFAEAARREQLTMKLSNYFSQQGYLLVETPTVEYPETLERGGSESDAFRFVDIDGNLIALRSDVTGSLARVVATRFSKIDPPYRLRYVADVFREKESLRGSDRQMTQIGIECFGLAAQEADAEVLSLALGGLQTVGLSEVYLHLSDVSLIGKLIEQSFAAGDTELIMQAWRDGDFIRFKDLMKAANLSGSCVDRRKLITSLLKLSGDESALDAAAQLLDQNQEARDALENLRACYRSLVERFPTQKVVIDFSLPPRLDYYSGIIFELNVATAQGRSRCVGSGGRYDTLLARFGRDLPAVGFVYELTQLEALIESFEQAPEIADTTLHPLRIAIPKGKLFDDSVALLKAVGVDIPGLDNPGRTLSFSTPDYEVIIAKPTDVA